MAIPLDLLLRLPPALRSSIITTSPSQSSTILQWLPRRPFSNTPSRLVRQTKPPSKPTHTPRPKLTTGKPPPNAPPPTSRPPPTNLPPRPPVFAPKPPIRAEIFSQLSKTPTLLLYRAPSHTSLQLSSFLLGTAAIFATYQQTLLARADPGDIETGRLELKVPWYLRSIWLFVGLCYALASARAYMAPLKMIRRISLTTQPSAGTLETMGGPTAGRNVWLRFEMRHPVPFARRAGVVIEAPLKGVTLDSEVQSHDLSYNTIPVNEAGAWTAAYAEKPIANPKATVDADSKEAIANEQAPVVAEVKAEPEKDADVKTTRSLWETTKQDIRRIFYRDGMAYVRIPGKGNWKLDLSGCEMLDHGRPLEEAMKVEPRLHGEQSWVGHLKTWLGR